LQKASAKVLEEVFELKIGDVEFVTLGEALASTRKQMIERFSKHVNPEEAKIFRLGDWDKRWVKAEGIRVCDDQGVEYLDFLGGFGALLALDTTLRKCLKLFSKPPSSLCLLVLIHWSRPWPKTFIICFPAIPMFSLLEAVEQRRLRSR